MAVNLAVGFAPAVTGGAGKGVTASDPAAEQAVTPLGLFGALLGAATIKEPAAVELAVAGKTGLDTAATALPDAPVTLGVDFSVEAPPAHRIDGEALFADLVDALAAIDAAQAHGEPPSPVLTQKLEVTLDALAGLLGITPPVEPAVDPTVLAAAIAPGPAPDAAPGESEALLGLVAEKAPALKSQSLFVPVPGSVDSTAPPIPAASSSIAASPVATPPTSTPVIVAGVGALPQIEVTPQPPPAPQPAPAVTGDEVAIGPASDLDFLVKKIIDVAQTMEPHSPGLAKRLEALVQKLTAGEVSAQTLAGLGIDADQSLTDLELDQALQHLLAVPVVKGTPAPQAFAAAELELPETIVLPPKAKAVGPATPLPAAIPAPKVEQKPATPNSPAAPVEIAAAKPEVPVELASNTQPGVQAAAPPPAAIVAGTKAIHAAYQAPVQQLNIPQVAFEMVRQVQAGNSRFQIRLDPPELGRIDVKLDMDGNGNVNARMTVERAETLDLMQRDQRALERALAQAGLDSSKTSLEFSLRQNPFGREDGGDGRGQRSSFGTGGDVADLGELPAEPSQTQYRGSASAGGVNLFV